MLLVTRHFSRKALAELLRLALPMVVSQGTFAVMIFTDRYFMSQIDPVHMAASLGGGVASFFSFCFFIGLLGYANAMAAQYLGAGEPGGQRKVGGVPAPEGDARRPHAVAEPVEDREPGAHRRRQRRAGPWLQPLLCAARAITRLLARRSRPVRRVTGDTRSRLPSQDHLRHRPYEHNPQT